MFMNAAGESLFSNNEAEKQCGRWNRGLRSAVSSDAGFRRPLEVAAMFEDAMNDSADNAAAVIGRPASVRLPHPSIEGLSVKIDRSWPLSGLLQMSPSYVVTFLDAPAIVEARSEEHTSELQSLMRTSYSVFCLKKKKY